MLASPRAVEMGIYITSCSFVRLKGASASYAELAKGLALSHDTFSRNTRTQLKQLFDALRVLMAPPDPPKRPTGSSRCKKRTRKPGHEAKADKRTSAARAPHDSNARSMAVWT